MPGLQDERSPENADALTLTYLHAAEAIAASHIDDFAFATNTLPGGWVTRQQVEKTHGAIDTCLNLLHQLMPKTGQDLEDGKDMGEPVVEVQAEENGDNFQGSVSSPGPGESELREPSEVQAMVDDIMAQPIATENLDAKFKTMAGILNGELPWPKFIMTTAGQHEGLDSPRIECAQQASRKMEEMVQSYQGAKSELCTHGEAAKKAKPRTTGRRSRGKRSKGHKPGSKALKTLRRTSRASKAKVHAAQAKKAKLGAERSKKPKTAKKARRHARSSRSSGASLAAPTENDIPESPAALIEDAHRPAAVAENDQVHTPDARPSENVRLELDGAAPAEADAVEVPAHPAPAEAAPVEAEVDGPPAENERWIQMNSYENHPLAQRYAV
eukprot:s599_g21.t1